MRESKTLSSTLAGLREADWARAGVVTGAGTPLTRTVRDYAERLARHERPHVKQIARAIEVLALRG